jgi:hypothetical protein
MIAQAAAAVGANPSSKAISFDGLGLCLYNA